MHSQNNSGYIHLHAHQLFMKFILLLLCIGYVNPIYSQVNTDNFESGTIDEAWKFSINNRGDSKTRVEISTSQACGGTYSLKATARYPGYRAEVSYRGNPFKELKNGQEYWIGFAVYLADGWSQDGGESLFQAHHVPDKHLGEPGGNNPPLLLRTAKGQWKIQARTETEKLCGNCDKKVIGKSIGAYNANAWTKFVFNVKFTHKNSGFLKLWKDDELVINYSGPIGYYDEIGPFLKMGVYKSAWKNDSTNINSRTAYYDNFRIKIGSGSPTDVAPSCGNVNKQLSPPASLKIIQN